MPETKNDMDRNILKITFSYFLFQILFCNKNGNNNMTIIYAAYICKLRIKTRANGVQFQRC